MKDEMFYAINWKYRKGYDDAMADRWIPVEKELPKVDEDGEGEYSLLSLSNFSTPVIGQYRTDSDGGAFYNGDDDRTLVSYGLFVNAWMPLPKPYREDKDEKTQH